MTDESQKADSVQCMQRAALFATKLHWINNFFNETLRSAYSFTHTFQNDSKIGAMHKKTRLAPDAWSHTLLVVSSRGGARAVPPIEPIYPIYAYQPHNKDSRYRKLTGPIPCLDARSQLL